MKGIGTERAFTFFPFNHTQKKKLNSLLASDLVGSIQPCGEGRSGRAMADRPLFREAALQCPAVAPREVKSSLELTAAS